MNEYIKVKGEGLKPRCVIFGEYIRDNSATIRQTAAAFGLSKTIVHNEVKKKLKSADRSLYMDVFKILTRNYAEKHIRGGAATGKLYTKYPGRSQARKAKRLAKIEAKETVGSV